MEHGEILTEAQCDVDATPVELTELVEETTEEAEVEVPMVLMEDFCRRPFNNSINTVTMNLLQDLQDLLTEDEGRMTRVVLTTILKRLGDHAETLGGSELGQQVYDSVQNIYNAVVEFENTVSGIEDLKPGPRYIP